MTARRWIVGRGLIGSAVEHAGTISPFSVDIPWGTPRAPEALAAGLDAFMHGSQAIPREIVWSAGRAVTSTPASDVAREAAVFLGFLGRMAALPHAARERLTIALVSSVGGVWGGASAPPFTEDSPTASASAYGEGKLTMERELTGVAAETGVRALIARVSNVYGPGQALGKGQGLVSALVRARLLGRPASIYVPLDTLRDYIFEDDAGRLIDAATARAATTPPGTTTVKIVGSGNAVSIGALIGELQRYRRHRGPVILGSTGGAGQALDLRVRSRVWTDLDTHVRTTLPEGIARVYTAQLADHLLGD